jgi:ABC-type transport system involved in multi-copper enzyme maturation permease subunit
MSDVTTTLSGPRVRAPERTTRREPSAGGLVAWLPSRAMITTKLLELRKRRGLMIAVVILTLALPVLVLGLRLLFHAVDPHSYGPAGSPGIFQSLVDPMAEFGFIAAAALGATAGTSDLTEGVFRHLVTTGRSRVSLYLARIPAGLAIIVPLVAAAFTMVCLVTAYEGTPQPTAVQLNGYNIPANLSQSQFTSWVMHDPNQAELVFGNPKGSGGPAISVDSIAHGAYPQYLTNELGQLNPPMNEMIKIGLWVELDVAIAFLVGLGFGSLVGQRTVVTIVMIAVEIIVIPILASATIPYFLNGQRLFFGVAMDQLRPAGLASDVAGPTHHGAGGVLFGGHAALQIPPMPTWAMIAVIAGSIVAWTGIGAWRMATRDA